MSGGRAPVGTAALLLGLGSGVLALVVLGTRASAPGSFGSMNREEARFYIGAALGAGAAFLAAAALVRRGRRWPGWVLPGILLLGLGARLAVLAAPPLLSTDLYRYVWDGRVQAAGINPYRFLPADPALAGLRDAGSGAAAIFPNINRADTAPTIYPPAAQLLFAALARVAPSALGVKAAMLGFDLLTTLAVLLLLRTAGLPAERVLVWFWNPLVIWEFAGGGHVDAAAVAASGLALLAIVRGRRTTAGALLGMAVLFKLLPAALFPALWRRWDLRVPVAAALVVAAGYVLYASAGWRVLGYLPGYAAEEGLNGGGFLALRLLGLLGPVPPVAGKVYAALALLFLAAVAARIALREPFSAAPKARAIVICRDALLLSGALIAVLSPHYPWYLTAVALPAAVAPAAWALWLTVAGPLLYLDHGHDEVLYPALVFVPALLLLLLDVARRSGTAPPRDFRPPIQGGA